MDTIYIQLAAIVGAVCTLLTLIGGFIWFIIDLSQSKIQTKLEDKETQLQAKIKSVTDNMNDKILNTNRKLDLSMAEVRKDISEIKGMLKEERQDFNKSIVALTDKLDEYIHHTDSKFVPRDMCQAFRTTEKG